MKIMITGCHGQLGNELQSILKSGKSEIGEIDKALLNSEILPVDIDTLDITDTNQVSEFVKANKPDVIINCAAMTNVDGCESDYATAIKVNAIGVR
ncbi:MAG: sugar nucleotide-binding protein, partial [Clostridia bacterium]|nr:sugar nucleotide-binding protein [Clostridia bacterium]